MTNRTGFSLDPGLIGTMSAHFDDPALQSSLYARGLLWNYSAAISNA